MDLVSQIPPPADLPPSGASMQLVSLAAAVGGVLLAALLFVVLAGWIARRRARTGVGFVVGHAGDVGDVGDAAVEGLDDRNVPDAIGPADTAAGPIVSSLRLLVVAILAVFLMPAAAAVRQLWPHPDLGWPMVAGWVAALLPVLVAWLALGRVVPGESTTRRSGE